jgi:NAD-dependent SIR2 family protein deacetylase
MFSEKDIQLCCDWLRKADSVLIGAGSGITVDAGIDYLDETSFARDYPGMAKRGFRMHAQLMGYEDWKPALKWGYLAAHVNQVRFQASPHPVYRYLFDLIKGKDYFVITSNVDGMFIKNGFAEERFFSPQGDYALMQCQTPCSNATWPTKPILDRILPTINPESQEITDPSVIPHCPKCGGDVMLNVRGGDWFLENPYAEQAQRFSSWVQNTLSQKLLIVEIGAGFNTPGVVRWPMERITRLHPNANLIRINRNDPDVPPDIIGKTVILKERGLEAIRAIRERSGNLEQ